MDWTEETIARLRGLWAEGHSTAEIGRRLGVTKNAVVGKAHRLDLPARPSPIRRDGVPGAQPRRLATRRVAGPTLPPLSSSAPESDHPELTVVTSGEVPAAAIVEPVAQIRQPETAPRVVVTEEMATQNFPSQTFAPGAPTPQAPAALEPVQPPAPVLVRPERLAAAPPPVASRTVPHAVARLAPQPRPYARSLTCCWPIGEPGTPSFRFCDEAAAGGKPYCAPHAAVAYVKVRDRREDAA